MRHIYYAKRLRCGRSKLDSSASEIQYANKTTIVNRIL